MGQKTEFKQPGQAPILCEDTWEHILGSDHPWNRTQERQQFVRGMIKRFSPSQEATPGSAPTSAPSMAPGQSQ